MYCKKLRKLTHNGVVTHNKAIKCLGTHLKNLRKFRMKLVERVGTRDLSLNSEVQAMLMGCSKLERLDITLWHGGLTDVGLEYIGKYGASLRSLSLTRAGDSDAGFVNLSKGCRRKLKLMSCPFSEQFVTSYVFNIPSL
ncbi:probable ubiquitin-like-specific protease 2B isoform X3, partial [Tanacetum coccineum]